MKKYLVIVWFAVCFIFGWFLASAFTQKAEAADPATWVLLGDSIMSEVYPSVLNGDKGNPAQLAANIIEVERNIHIRNLSGSGAALGLSNAQGFANIVPAIQTVGGPFSGIKGIIIQAGTNDYGLSVNKNSTNASLRAILTYARKAKKKVLVVDTTYRQDEAKKNKLGLRLGDYRWARMQICAVEFKDVCKFVPRDTGPFDSLVVNYYAPAEVQGNWALHLNAAGHRAWADWVMQKAAEVGYF